MPVVMGQPIVAPCRRARIARMPLIVISFPFETRFMMSSTSFGAGMATVPAPHFFVIRPSIGATRGSPRLSASFSDHVLRFFVFVVLILSSFD